jgi:quinol monooxygenase YgiN
MITCTLRMNFGSENRTGALQVLRSLKGPVRSQSGCTQTLLMSDVQDSSVLTWISRWRNRETLDRHLKSNHFRRILAVMELAADPPQIEFESGCELWGLDLIDEVLGGETVSRQQPIDMERNTHEGVTER